MDEVWTPATFEYKGKKLNAVGKGAVELGSEEERKKAEQERKDKDKTYKALMESLPAAIAAAYKRRDGLAGQRVVCVMSGGNIDAAKLKWVLGS